MGCKFEVLNSRTWKQVAPEAIEELEKLLFGHIKVDHWWGFYTGYEELIQIRPQISRS